ncbi:MAG: GGDEF domain-containing protein [Woeseiaceae bacterium]
MVEDEIRVSSLVTVDDLTQVASRRGFNLIAEHLLSLCRREDIAAELVYLDLDGFEAINNTYGHAAGDELPVYLAKLLIKCFRIADAPGRLGGDGFVVLLSNSGDGATAAFERLKRALHKLDSGMRSKLAWSAGVSMFALERHADIDCLLADADASMYDDEVRRRSATPG